VKVHFVEPPPALRVGGLDAAIRSLEAALRSEKIDVVPGDPGQAQCGDLVHFHGLWQPSHARLSAKLRRDKVPCIVSPHGMLEPWAWRHKWWKKWPYFWLVESGHLRRANCILATSAQEERTIRGFFARQDVRSLPLGFTADAAPDYDSARAKLGWSPDERVLLYLSRLHEKKGLDMLIEALALVGAPAGTRLVIVGGGETAYVKSVQAAAAALQPKLPRVDWIGEVWGDARWPYFQGADLFCLPSHSENFGLAVLEACQVGTPVLTTSTTPWGEWLHGECAYISEPTIAGIAEQLRKFFSRPKAAADKREEFANSMKQQFSWSALAPRYVELYRTLAKTPAH
jgi:glycosyltransferase involved in cell wall biosynthesis